MNEIIEVLSKLNEKSISKVEVVSLCHMLRLYFNDEWVLDLSGSWRCRSDKSILLGGMDMDFYMEVDDDFLNEEDAYYVKKASSLVGKKVKSVTSSNGDIFFELSGKRYIDFFNLSSDDLSIMLRRAV